MLKTEGEKWASFVEGFAEESLGKRSRCRRAECRHKESGSI